MCVRESEARWKAAATQAVGRSQDCTGKQGSLWTGKGCDGDRWQRPVVQTGHGGRGWTDMHVRGMFWEQHWLDLV